MKYNFSFDRKRLLTLLAGLMLVGLLIFVGGMVTGVALWAPARDQIALLKTKGVQAPAVAAAGPAPPVLPVVPPAPALPTVTVPSKPKAAEAAPAPVEVAAKPAAAPAPASAEALPEPPAMSSPAALSASRGPFCLQLGSFEKQENAKKLQSDLKDKGYAAIIFEQIDSEQRTWHAVRIGGFSTLDSAARAASDFSSKERIQALVRKSDAL